MRQHQSEPKKNRNTDPFVSPLHVRRTGQMQNSAPVLADLSPFPFSFMTRSHQVPGLHNLMEINTPVPGRQTRQFLGESVIESIIKDWGDEELPNQIIRKSREQPESSSLEQDQSVSEENSQSSEEPEPVVQMTPNNKGNAAKKVQSRPEESEQSEQQSQPHPQKTTVSKPKQKNLSIYSSQKKVTCNCKKTKCLKLYCDCFRVNQACDGCNCLGCHNTNQYEEERNNAILTLMERNTEGFKPKIVDQQHSKGCNCKKSNCQKKYCECFQAGLKCCELCKCQECKNGMEGHVHPEQEHNNREVKESPMAYKQRSHTKGGRTTAKKSGRFQQYEFM